MFVYVYMCICVYVFVRDNLENGWMDFYNFFFICSLWILSNTWTTFFRKKWKDGRSASQKRIFSYIKVYIYYKIQIVISVKIAHWPRPTVFVKNIVIVTEQRIACNGLWNWYIQLGQKQRTLLKDLNLLGSVWLIKLNR